MTYLFKLAKRIAIVRVPLLVSALGSLAGCGGGQTLSSEPAITRPPEYTSLTVAPRSAEITVGDSLHLVAWAHRASGDSVSVVVNWGASGGIVNTAGWFKATAGGRYSVSAQLAAQAGLQASMDVDVAALPSLTALILDPATAAVQVGDTNRFAAVAIWTDGSVALPSLTWTASGGTISGDGLFRAGQQAGSYYVIATTAAGVADTARVEVVPPVATLIQLFVNPTQATVTTGATIQLAASATWSDGGSAAPLVTWSAPNGNVSPSGLYTASAVAGVYDITATLQGGSKTASAHITVVAPRIIGLDLTPKSSTFQSGETVQFSTAATWSDGQDRPYTVTYSTTGGSITSGGLYTAGLNAGTFLVIAMCPGGKADTVPVVVNTALARSATTLRAAADARHFLMGTAVNVNALRNEATYRQVLAAQYNSVVPEGAMKFAAIHPAPTQYSFSAADDLVSFAQANNMAIHGHTLVWHESLPNWITGGSFTKAQLLAVLKDHIETVVGRYRGKVASWDVVNEIVADNAVTLRPTIWTAMIGPEYIDSAFVWAHRADPAAKLYVNETWAEANDKRSNTLLTFVQTMRTRGIPVDGVGFEAHFTTTPPAAASIRANFAKFANAGFDIRVSEMDVRIADWAGPSELDRQAATFRDVLDACLSVSRCVGFSTWGFTDRYSWIPGWKPGYGRALPFDTNYQSKPAFTALLARLQQP